MAFTRYQRRHESVNQDVLVLEFDAERKLFYQSHEVPQNLKYIIHFFSALVKKYSRQYIDIQNMLTLPTTLSYKVILGKNALFFYKLEDALENAFHHNRPLSSELMKIDNTHFEVLVKKSVLKNDKINGFSVLFHLNNPKHEKLSTQTVHKEINTTLAQLKKTYNVKNQDHLWNCLELQVQKAINHKKPEELQSYQTNNILSVMGIT